MWRGQWQSTSFSEHLDQPRRCNDPAICHSMMEWYLTTEPVSWISMKMPFMILTIQNVTPPKKGSSPPKTKRLQTVLKDRLWKSLRQQTLHQEFRCWTNKSLWHSSQVAECPKRRQAAWERKQPTCNKNVYCTNKECPQCAQNNNGSMIWRNK